MDGRIDLGGLDSQFSGNNMNMYKKEWKLRAALKRIQPINISISELLICILGSKSGPVSPSVRIDSGVMESRAEQTQPQDLGRAQNTEAGHQGYMTV